MRIIRDLQVNKADKGTVLALGNFDGVHRGHQAILHQCVELARAAGCTPAAMTFEPHPREFFARDHQPLRIYPLRRKLELLADMGIKTVFLVRFNRQFSSITAQSFIEDILFDLLAVRHVVTGYNFAFGKGRQGNVALLAEEGKKLGFAFTAIPPVKDEAQVISSSAIREALKKGDMATASHMLGRPYQIIGRVKHGAKRGKTLGYPTANLSLKTRFLPRFGIYAARFACGNEFTWHDAVVNLGVRPMFSDPEPLLEVHGLDMNRTLYGQRIRVELLDFIRDEQTFADIEALKAQIAEDCKKAKQLLAKRAG